VLTTIVSHLCDVHLQTPKGDLEIRIELCVFRDFNRRATGENGPAVTVRRRLQASAASGEAARYFAYADASQDADQLPARAEDLVATDVVADMIRDLIDGLREKAVSLGDRTGIARLGPPSFLTADELSGVLEELDAERQDYRSEQG
jgi:hypothetical protein